MKELLTPQTKENKTLQSSLDVAVSAAFEKKARDVVILELEGICSFSDRFLISTGMSVRQTQAIADNIDEKLRQTGVRPSHVEGYGEGEWILMDYVDFVVHVFTERTREFYDLERLWRAGTRVEVPEPTGQRT